MYIVYECCDTKLIDVLYGTDRAFDDHIARYIIRELLNALIPVHAWNSHAHREINIENILFDSEYNLKLLNFGFDQGQDSDLDVIEDLKSVG